MGVEPSRSRLLTISKNVGDALEMTAADMLREIGGHGRTKNVIDRAAKLTGLTYWRAFDIIYGKVRHIEPNEMDRIRQVLKVQRETRGQIQNLEYRIARLERILDRRSSSASRASTDLFGEVVRGGC